MKRLGSLNSPHWYEWMSHLGGMASLVAANGAIKNLGKLMAPVLLGLLVLVMPISTGFAVVAAVAALVASLKVYDSNISRRLPKGGGPL